MGEAGMVVVVGRVVGEPEVASTKVSYTLEDNSGRVGVVYWLQEEDRGATFTPLGEGVMAKATGSVRCQAGETHIMAFKVKEICQAEAEAHLLEVVYSHLKLRQLRLRAQQTANGTNGT